MNDRELLRRMRSLIGRRCLHLGQSCTLIEVLADEATLVLRCGDGGAPPIQADQFGRAVRRASETRQVPLFKNSGEDISDEALELLYGLGRGGSSPS